MLEYQSNTENLTVARFPATNKKECDAGSRGDISSVKERLPAYNACLMTLQKWKSCFGG